MGELFPFFGGAWFWWIVAGVLLIGELTMPGVFLIWLAGAATLTGIVDLVFHLNWQGELAVFAVVSVLLVIASWNYVRRQHSPKSDQPDLNQRQIGYVGRRSTVMQAISNGSGKVRIDDSVWDASGPDLPQGTQVIVTGVKGSTLVVEAVS
jgi:inner membrane protein